MGGGIAVRMYMTDERMRASPQPWDPEDDTEDAGNGSLVRLASVPILYFNDLDAARAVAKESSYATHSSPNAACACEFFSYLIARAIADKNLPAVSPISVKGWMDAVVENFLTMMDANPNLYSGKGWDLLQRLLMSAEPDSSPECNWNWRSPDVILLEVE